MDINELTLGQAKELQGLLGGTLAKSSEHPFEIGKNYLIRTVTMIQLGRLVAVYDTELVLRQAAWIANTGRFHEALEKGVDKIKWSEIELFNRDVIIGRGALVDACIYTKPLPTENK